MDFDSLKGDINLTHFLMEEQVQEVSGRIWGSASPMVNKGPCSKSCGGLKVCNGEGRV